MKIGLLCFTPIGGSVRSKKLSPEVSMLKEAALKLGHEVFILWFEKCQMLYDSHGPRVLFKGKKFPHFDVIIPRFELHKASINVAGVFAENLSLLRQIEMMGIPVVNEFSPVTRAKSKLRTLQILSKHKIPIPKTIVVRRLEYIDSALRKIGKMPVILKTAYGSLGVGVAIVESRRSLVSALDILWGTFSDNTIMIQEYIKESEGQDIRVFVVGGKIVAAMRRIARDGEFRSNINRGGMGEPVTLTPYEKKLALSAADAIGLDVAGVDLLEREGGPVVAEVNGNPGFHIVEVTGVDVVTEIVKFAVKKAKAKKVARSRQD